MRKDRGNPGDAPEQAKALNLKCEGTLERDLRSRGYANIAGADEVGRGSLFGAVVAGAVILSRTVPFAG